MVTSNAREFPSYEQFRDEWVSEIEEGTPSNLEKGRRFATKVVEEWLSVDSDSPEFIICDGSGDGGIDVAYLQRAESLTDSEDANAIEGDKWYLVQGKYGSAFQGSSTVLSEGTKVLETLTGAGTGLSGITQDLVAKLDTFRLQASPLDQMSLVFATTDPMGEEARSSLENLQIIGRERGLPNFVVEQVSVRTLWENLPQAEASHVSVPIRGRFIEQQRGFLLGMVSLSHLFEFLKEYAGQARGLHRLYEKNVRQFLKGKINKRIASTLTLEPDKFGLYNNGITIVVKDYYSGNSEISSITLQDPYVVNGCQTTRTIWQVLDARLNSGGTGHDPTLEEWKKSLEQGGVVVKIVTSDEAEIGKITKFTNSQNSVKEQDFVALEEDFQAWASTMARDYNMFLEVQKAGIEAQKAYEHNNPQAQRYGVYANAFDLLKVYGAGWLGVPGLAFNKNAAFIPGGSKYDEMVGRSDDEARFGAQDLYAAYLLKAEADRVGFGRKQGLPRSRRLSRFLFYFVMIRILSELIRQAPDIEVDTSSMYRVSRVVNQLGAYADGSLLQELSSSAARVIDAYLNDPNSDNCAYKEQSYLETHNSDLNSFLKAEKLGTEAHSPLLRRLIDIRVAALQEQESGLSSTLATALE